MTISAATAADLVATSQSDQAQQELMKEYDENFQQRIVLEFGRRIGADISNIVEDISVERSIEGSSNVVVKVMDYDRELLKKGNLKKGLDIEIDKLVFRLSGFDKAGDHLSLNFETREIAFLRSYPKTGIGPGDVLEHGPLGPFSRDQMTRAEFVLQLIREVKEEKIKWIIPQLHKVQPIEDPGDVPTGSTYVGTPGLSSPADTSQGSAADQHHHPGDAADVKSLTVKGPVATAEQVRNADIILKVGSSMGARRKVLVVAIMVAIQESTLRTSATNGDHLGLFQQDSGWGSVSDRRDAATSARLFIKAAMDEDKKAPGLPYYALGGAAQNYPRSEEYAPWRTEAERFVTDFGLAGGDTTGTAGAAGGLGAAAGFGGVGNVDGAYYFYRGIPPTSNQRPWHREDSWSCIQRLADEVQWRAFFVGDVFYFIDEFTLFRSKPRMTFSEFSEGITQIDANYDTRKKNAQITITARLAKWGAPPGSVVVLQDVGPLDGRWLVESVSRSLFDPYAQITCSKPRPALPEPLGGNLSSSQGADAGVAGVPATGVTGYVNPFGGASVRPGRIDQGVDYSGTGPIRAIGAGKILNVYNSGWPGGVYIMLQLTSGPHAGDIVFYAEGINPAVHVGQVVQAGQTIGTFVPGSSTGIEIGWSSPVPGLVADPYNGRPDGTKTEGGKSFATFLQQLGVPTVAIG